jgi:hypothetical protein
MPDNWGYVLAAYLLAALAFGGYWRRLARREREVRTLAAARRERTARDERATRGPAPSGTAHPRSEAASRPPLQ